MTWKLPSVITGYFDFPSRVKKRAAGTNSILRWCNPRSVAISNRLRSLPMLHYHWVSAAFVRQCYHVYTLVWFFGFINFTLFIFSPKWKVFKNVFSKNHQGNCTGNQKDGWYSNKYWENGWWLVFWNDLDSVWYILNSWWRVWWFNISLLLNKFSCSLVLNRYRSQYRYKKTTTTSVYWRKWTNWRKFREIVSIRDEVIISRISVDTSDRNTNLIFDIESTVICSYLEYKRPTSCLEFIFEIKIKFSKVFWAYPSFKTFVQKNITLWQKVCNVISKKFWLWSNLQFVDESKKDFLDSGLKDLQVRENKQWFHCFLLRHVQF